ncbi:MAG TPA: hypothetical protein VLD37_06830 [Candidatus Bilamarchaeum sp.]|nr:hypothetical protein [Candidatus Bilamarchaeum sp.]
MTEGAFASSLVPKKPDYASALIALNAATDLLESAREKMTHDDLPGALENSRDAIRLASSALLFRDGYVAGSLEDTASYLSKRYPGVFPLADWDTLEVAASGRVTLYKLLLSAMGKIKKDAREEAGRALTTAEAFISSARSELEP